MVKKVRFGLTFRSGGSRQSSIPVPRFARGGSTPRPLIRKERERFDPEMATTSLIVEVLVIGMVALSAILLLATGLADPANSQELTRIQGMARDLSVPFAMPVLAISYALGWIVNFQSGRL